jgi:hypothetical protein
MLFRGTLLIGETKPQPAQINRRDALRGRPQPDGGICCHRTPIEVARCR